jgi:chitin synthase
MRFLSRIYYNEPLNPLEIELARSMDSVIGIKPSLFEFMLMVDADTFVARDSIVQMTSNMVRDTRIIGLCGETRVENENESWITIIQIYEYFISQHLSKAFESKFGSVTCLPGCFSMYRLFSKDQKKALFLSKQILHDYSKSRVDSLHLKNLLHLGEDRYLTTLLIKHFPQWTTTYAPAAQCKTVVPKTWSIFLSQRRRWINSTVHNLIELSKMKSMCGSLVFSMRFVVLVDLLSTIIQPATLVYLLYLVFIAIADKTTIFPLISILLVAIVYGLQFILYIIQGEVQNLGWMFAYILALPIYSFVLPIYSFWHFDDFSWGDTRMVYRGNMKGGNLEDILFDPSMLILKQYNGPNDSQSGDLNSSSTTRKSPPSSPRPSVSKEQRYSIDSFGSLGSNSVSKSPPRKSMAKEQRYSVDSFASSQSISFRNASSRNSFDSLASKESPKVEKRSNGSYPTDEELFKSIQDYISKSDLSIVTKKNVLQHLEVLYEFQADSDMKKAVYKMVNVILKKANL